MIGLIVKFERMYRKMNEQSVMSDESIPLCDRLERRLNGTKGSLATTIP
jgi:hypothetical protein